MLGCFLLTKEKPQERNLSFLIFNLQTDKKEKIFSINEFICTYI